MFFSGFSSYAAENFNLIELLDIQDEFIIASDLGDGTYNYFVQDNTYEQTYHDMYAHGFNYNANNAVSDQLNSLDFNKYVGAFNTDFSQFILYYLPEDSFIVQNNQRAVIYAAIQYSDVGAGYNAGFPVFRSSDGVQFSVDWQTVGYGSSVDDVSYSVISFSTSNGAFDNICSCNIPVYYYDSNNFNFDSLDDLEELNNPITGGSGGYSEADIINNNYIGNNNRIYMNGGSLNTSNLYVLLDFNKAQMSADHIDQDKLTYSMDIVWTVRGKCTADSKSRKMLNYYFGDGTAHWWDNITPGTWYNFDTTFSGDWSDLSASNENVIAASTYNDGIYYNGKTGWTMADYLGAYGGKGSTVNGAEHFINTISGCTIAGSHLPQFTATQSIDLTTCYYDVTVNVFYNGQQLNDSPIVGRCDWLSGKSDMISNAGADQSTVNSAVTNNNTGLLPGDPGFVDPSNYNGTIKIDSGNSSASGGSGGSGGNIESGAIVINNNPTFNNDSSSESSAGLSGGGLIGFLTGLLVGQKKSSTDQIEDMANTSGWLNIMNTTFSYVPAGVWTLLIGAFTAAIGIMIVSFIISIFIKFIT